MTDPYQVLGDGRGASDEEIKKAYRSLSRRYHPDANVNNPNRAQAEERFKQVQQAYDQIIKERQQGTSGYTSYGSAGNAGGRTAEEGPFGGFSGTYYYGNAWRGSKEEQSPKMQAALHFLRSRSYEEALHVLEEVPFAERNGRWYYYSAVANHRLGNTVTALEHINRALSLEPSNQEYRQFQQSMQYGGTWYTNMGSSYERPYSSYSNFCMSLLCMQMLCSCCCRPF